MPIVLTIIIRLSTVSYRECVEWIVEFTKIPPIEHNVFNWHAHYVGSELNYTHRSRCCLVLRERHLYGWRAVWKTIQSYVNAPLLYGDNPIWLSLLPLPLHLLENDYAYSPWQQSKANLEGGHGSHQTCVSDSMLWDEHFNRIHVTMNHDILLFIIYSSKLTRS